MQKFAVISGVASILGLGIAVVTVFTPVAGVSGDVVNYGSGGQAIGIVEGNVENNSTKNYSINHNYPPPRKPKAGDALPPGFSLDDNGFVLNINGERVCDTVTTNHETFSPGFGDIPGGSGSYTTQQTRCKMWDGSWSFISDSLFP